MASTIKDIARETGLGFATISNYLNGKNVRDKNKVLIEAAIKKLNFEVNEVARGLKTNKTRTVGIVIPTLNNIFFSAIAAQVGNVFRNHGYATIICDYNEDAKQEKAAVDFLYKKRVDGLINMPSCQNGRHLESFYKAQKPIVLFDRKIEGIECDTVLVENKEAVASGVQLLIRNGHKRIGIIAGPNDIFTANERLAGYIQAMEEANLGVDEKLIIHGNYSTIVDGTRAFKELVSKNPDMTAVIATNYEMTVGMIISSNEQNIQIPDKLSVIGYDSKEFAQACRPRLTMIAQPTTDIAINVANIMLSRLEEDVANRSVSKTLKLKTILIEGSSIKKI